MDHNKELFDGMILYCAVVEQNGLTAAAKLLGHTPSHVSKEIARLEARLGSRLLNRTTRKISLTETGRVYYENARRIVEDAKIAQEKIHTLGDRPFGTLKIGVPLIFARACLNKWLPEFAETYPDITLEIDVTDRKADLIAEGIDLLVRIGNLPPSDFIARELFKTELLTVAAPDYLEQNGYPETPHDLSEHTLIDFSYREAAHSWSYPDGKGGMVSVSVVPKFRCNDAEMELALAVAGRGITRLPLLACTTAIDEGSIIPILTQYQSAPTGVQIIYPSRDNLPQKTRAMIDFLVSKSKVLHNS